MKTLKHPDTIGNGSLTALETKRVDITTFGTDADALDCLQITFSPEVYPGAGTATSPSYGTVAVDADGAGANKARITLTVGYHNASGTAATTSFTIDCDGTANGAWSAGNVTVYDLKGVIDAINSDDAGGTYGKLLRCFKARIGPGGMYDLVVTGALALQDESAEYVQDAGTPGTPTGFLKRDMAVHTIDSDFLLYWRLAMPENEDRGLFKLLDLYGTVGTNTGATVYVVRDDVDDYVKPTGTWATDIANHDEIYSVAVASLPAYANYVGAYALGHNPAEAAAVQGPLVVIVKGDTDAAQTVNLKAIMQAVS
jgi:hypothetical protein